MIENVYMLFDTVSNLFVGAMSIIINDAVAIRSFTEFVRDPKCPYRVMADDLKLYRIGTFNTESGDFDSNKFFICDLRDLLILKSEVNDDEKV